MSEDTKILEVRVLNNRTQILITLNKEPEECNICPFADWDKCECKFIEDSLLPNPLLYEAGVYRVDECPFDKAEEDKTDANR